MLKHLAFSMVLASVGSAEVAPPVVVDPAPKPAANPDDEGTPKLSLPTESDRAAWKKAGFRLSLGVAYGRFEGIGGAPSGHIIGGVFRAGLRLDPDWSVISSFQYERVKQGNGLSGLRFSGTIDPTWHVTPAFSIAIGVGFGGIVEGRTGRKDYDPLADSLSASYTFPDASTPMPSCSGVGVTALARAEYTYILGPRAATGLAFELTGQETACIDRSRHLDTDTARPIERRQYWPHIGGELTWSITWR